MNFTKFLKHFFSLTLIIIILIAVYPVAYGYDIPEGLNEYASEIYEKARGYFGRYSFSGYCGTYVKCQLRAMGVFEGGYDCHGNGNQWYGAFENIEETSGGYKVYRFDGGDCINKMVASYGNDLKNIVVSLPIQSHHTAEYPGAGHAFIIYALKDGIAYYSESFSYGNHAEGTVIAEDVNTLMERYNSRFGNALGCVLLSKEPLMTVSEKLRIQEQQEQEELIKTSRVLASIEESANFSFFSNEILNIGEGAYISA